MAKPKRTFTGQEGQRSVGTAGPHQISHDFDNLFAALDPDDTYKDGTAGGIGEENLRQVTLDDREESTGNTGHIRQLFSWIANMIKKITGNANWYDAPKTTLTATKAHMDANTGVHGVGSSTVESSAGAQAKVDLHENKSAPHSGHETPSGAQNKVNVHESKPAPHSGHETPSGAQAKVDTHEAKTAPHSGHETPSGAQAKVDTHEAKTAPHSGHETPAGAQAKVNSHASETSAHSATAAATANRIVVRDPYGRAQVATPTLANEIANKSYVDTKIQEVDITGDVSGHVIATDAHSATYSPTANRIMMRDASGRAKVAAPNASDDIARKAEVDTVQTNLTTHANTASPHSGHATTAALNSHTGATSAHSATSAATANRIILRDASGRAKVAAPNASDDIARKAEVDTVQTNLTTHANTASPHSGHATTAALNSHTGATSAHSATSDATANRIMMRDAEGRAKVTTPILNSDIANKLYVDEKVAEVDPGEIPKITASVTPPQSPVNGDIWFEM